MSICLWNCVERFQQRKCQSKNKACILQDFSTFAAIFKILHPQCIAIPVRASPGDTTISRKVVGKNVHATVPKDNMGYDQYPVPDTVAVHVEPTFVTFSS